MRWTLLAIGVVAWTVAGCSGSRDAARVDGRAVDLKPLPGYVIRPPNVMVDDRFVTVAGKVESTPAAKVSKEPMHVHFLFMSDDGKVIDEFAMKLMPDNEGSPTRWRYGMKYGMVPDKWAKTTMEMTSDEHFVPVSGGGALPGAGNRLTRTLGTPPQRKQKGTPRGPVQPGK